MRRCLDCYYHSFIGHQNWCAHPGHPNRISNTKGICDDHIDYDSKAHPNKTRKHKYVEMEAIKKKKARTSSYELTHAGSAIECQICGQTSFHIDDVKHRYCGKCKIFHEEYNGGLHNGQERYYKDP